MKKLLSIILSLIMLLSITAGLDFSAIALSGSGSCGKDITYTFDSTGTLIIRGTGSMYAYSNEGDNCSPFNSTSSIKKVVIKEGVTSIGANVFRGCSLESITIPNTISYVGSGAFASCFSLRKTYIESITSWCNIRFDSTDSNPLSYANELYINNQKVSDIVIPSGVKGIPYWAFYDFSGLRSVTIGNDVEWIGGSAFAFSGITSVKIEDNVSSIGSEAFKECSYLSKVSLCDGLTTIKTGAFENCVRLSTINFPDSITSIESEAFFGCSSLTNLSLGNGLKSINDSTFLGCSNLRDVSIPMGVTNIRKNAFWGCSKLVSVDIPLTVNYIDENSFKNCDSLETLRVNNRNCTFYNDPVCNNSVIIYGYKNSPTEKFATDYNYSFIPISAQDDVKPESSLSSTNNVSDTQNVTLTMSDNKGVAGYFWGTSNTYSYNQFIKGNETSVIKKVSNSGTYYLTVVDECGNLSDTNSITFYKTTLNANGGSVSPASVLTKSGNSFTFPTPTRSNYTYQGWALSTTKRRGVKSLTPTENATYYAVWNESEEIDSTKPIGKISSTNDVAESQTVTLTMNDDKGIQCFYWGTNSNYSSNLRLTVSGSPESYISYKTISSAGTYYLTVKDTSGNISDTISITYYKTMLNANGGSVLPGSVLTMSEASFNLPTPTRNGYTFQGWNTSSTAISGVKYLNPKNNSTYYAVWLQNAVPDNIEPISKLQKKANTLKVKAKKPSIKFSKLKKKNQKLALKKVMTVSNAQGKVSFKKTKGNKKIKVAKNGKITVKKGLKKGTYKIKIQVTAAGNTEYNAAVKTVTVKIKVK